MRIIAGSVRGRTLKSPKTDATRPTADRLKESLFSILMPKLWQAQVLDVFAGSGALGLEALSRGAAFATFIEMKPATLQLIQDNIALCGFEDQTKIILGDALQKLKSFRPNQAMDLVLVDPPYQKELCVQTLEILASVSWLKPTSLIVIEHHLKEILSERVGRLVRYRQVKQGESVLSFYQNAEEESQT